MADDDLPLSHLSRPYLLLHILGGHIGLPVILLVIFFSKSISRHPLLVNFLVCWIIYSISYCLTLYTGQFTGSQPPNMACKAQAAMVHGTPTMAAAAGTAVVLQVWHTLQNPIQHLSRPFHYSFPLILALAFPYITFITFTVASIILAVQHPDSVKGNGLYCTIFLDDFRRYGVPTFSGAMIIIVICLEIVIVIRFLRMWSHIKQAFPLAQGRRTSLSICIRVTVFSFASVACLSASIITISEQRNAYLWSIMLQASLPLLAAVIFGTHKDILRACFICKPRHRARDISDVDTVLPSVDTPTTPCHEANPYSIHLPLPLLSPSSDITLGNDPTSPTVIKHTNNDEVDSDAQTIV